MTKFELQTLSFGVSHGLVARATGRRKLQKPPLRPDITIRCTAGLLVRLYDRYPEKKLLEAICCMRIKGDCQGPEDFVWYEKALKEQINLTRLYEYYLYFSSGRL